MSELGFRARLEARQVKTGSLLCVGFDPLVEKMPDIIRKSCPSLWSATLLWMKEIADATMPYASMVKPQRAHWGAIDNGARALQAWIDYIHYKYPDVPVFEDCKDGDIGRTQTQYRETHFTLEGVDGMNYNGYMGEDTLSALIDEKHPERALVGLGRTSNPKAWQIQDAILEDGRHVWELMATSIYEWSKALGVLDNAGIVMGAAHRDPKDSAKVFSAHLSRIKHLFGDALWLLIPGIGTQGGFAEATIRAIRPMPGNCAINSSSEIDFAGDGPDFADKSALAAEKTFRELSLYW